MNNIISIYKKEGFKGLSNKIVKALLWEKNNDLSLPFFKQLKYWKKGFKSSSYYIYHFKENDMKNYVSDVTVAQLSNINNEKVKEFFKR